MQVIKYPLKLKGIKANHRQLIAKFTKLEMMLLLRLRKKITTT